MNTVVTPPAKHERIPHGAAKAIVGALKPGEPVTVRKNYIGGIKSAAQYLGIRISCRKIFGPGGQAYSVQLAQSVEAPAS